MIITAALELSGNQVTHFYSAKKNTREMIRMMDVLINSIVTGENFIFRGTPLHGTSQNNFSLVSTPETRRFPMKAARSSRRHHYPQVLNS